jgi:PAS domain S-box-containing protein
MMLPQKRNGIVWLVRILTVIGLAMVVTTTGLVGWTLAGMRRERAEVTAEEARLDRASHQLRESESASRTEIQTALDETIPWKTKEPSAAEDFAALIHRQRNSLAFSTVVKPLDKLSDHAANLTEIAASARSWRTSYMAVWEDLREQRTMGRVRQLINQLRNAMETLEGRQRRDDAIEHKRWRQATGEEAARQARAILLETGRQESEGATDFDDQLAELARLVELLGGEEQFDSLTDLKDNKIKPVLDRLSRSIGALGFRGIGSSAFTPSAIEHLKVALFGEGAGSDEAHQNIEVGHGGLFTLRRDALVLRREREKLKSRLATEVQHVEAAHADFMRSTQTRSAALTRQMEQTLASGWNRLLLFGGGSAALFFWLARLITRGIDGQVHVIEQARVGAEASRQTTQQLLFEQQRAASELAMAHGGLQASEQRFRTLSASAPIGIFLTDPAGLALYLNPHCLAIIGLSQAEALGEGWSRAVHPEDAAAVFEEWKSTARMGAEYDREFRFLRPTGEARWTHVRTMAIRSDMGEVTGHVGTVEDIAQRKEAEANLEQMHKELLEASRQAGMAEMATGVLHNVGNVLNSVNVASSCMADSLRKSKAANLSKVVTLLREHESDLGVFLTSDPQGRKVPSYLAHLAEHLVAEQAVALKELAQLQKNIEHIKEVVTAQQSNAKGAGQSETLQMTDLLEDTLRMDSGGQSYRGIQVVREFEHAPAITVEKHKVLQILMNLVRNARQACQEAGGPEKRLTLRVTNGDDRVRIAVSDNGVGISPENLARIFAHGFTTKKDGHGFGLHSAIAAAKEMGGSLHVRSDGLGHGATFTLELPAPASA